MSDIQDPENWQDDLDIAGAGFFLRYRKRLFEPGILLTLSRENPGVSVADLWLRLRAGRRLVEFGHGLEALSAIRRGNWQPREMRRPSPPERPRSGDGLSRVLVGLGGALSLAFVALSMAAWLGPLGALLVAVAVGVIVVLATPDRLGLRRSLAGLAPHAHQLDPEHDPRCRV